MKAFYTSSHLHWGPKCFLPVKKSRLMLRLNRVDSITETEVELAHPPQAVSKSSARCATIIASKMGVVQVVEKQKALADYMALPASQYSVLDGRKVERIDDQTFQIYVGNLHFLNWEVEPVLTVAVNVEEYGCTIHLQSCKLQGSKFVNDINDKFSTRMTNVVRWRESEQEDAADRGIKEITSNTEIEVLLEIPSWCSFLSTSYLESVGRGVLSGVLNAMVPRFLDQLSRDYAIWAEGKDRSPAPDSGL